LCPDACPLSRTLKKALIFPNMNTKITAYVYYHPKEGAKNENNKPDGLFFPYNGNGAVVRAKYKREA
jgi:hypothetical protein